MVPDALVGSMPPLLTEEAKASKVGIRPQGSNMDTSKGSETHLMVRSSKMADNGLLRRVKQGYLGCW